MKPILYILLFFAFAKTLQAQSISPGGIHGASAAGVAGNVTVSWVIGNLSADDGLSAPLPVELHAFKGVPSVEGALLTWKTAWEKQNSGFEVQKSLDARSFVKIGWVPGSGTDADGNSYRYVDAAFSTTAYYRLGQRDHDGSLYYSRVIVVIPESESVVRLNVFPNPSTDGKMLAELPKNALSMELSDARGVSVRRINHPDAVQHLLLPGPGVYLLNVKTTNGQRTLKLVRTP